MASPPQHSGGELFHSKSLGVDDKILEGVEMKDATRVTFSAAEASKNVSSDTGHLPEVERNLTGNVDVDWAERNGILRERGHGVPPGKSKDAIGCVVATARERTQQGHITTPVSWSLTMVGRAEQLTASDPCGLATTEGAEEAGVHRSTATVHAGSTAVKSSR